MPNELLIEQVIVAYITQLKTIAEGSTYWNTIGDENISRHIKTIDQIHVSRMLMVVSSMSDFDHNAMPRFEKGQAELKVDGVVEHDGDPDEIQTLVHRLARDVMVASYANPTLGGISRAIAISALATDEGVLAYDGYGMFELGVTFHINYPWTAP